MAEAQWYPDPQNPAQFRYFDGIQWTQHVSPAGSPYQVAQPQMMAGGQTTSVTVMQVGTQKSVGLAIFLAVMFGPLGTFYGSVAGGAVLLVSSVVIGWLLIPLPFIYVGSIIWAAVGASQHNARLGVSSMSVSSQSPAMVTPGPVMGAPPTAAPAPLALALPTTDLPGTSQGPTTQSATPTDDSPWAPHHQEQIVDAEIIELESSSDSAPSDAG